MVDKLLLFINLLKDSVLIVCALKYYIQRERYSCDVIHTEVLLEILFQCIQHKAIQLNYETNKIYVCFHQIILAISIKLLGHKRVVNSPNGIPKDLYNNVT